MTTTTLGIIAGLIVVLGFAATIIITLLALIGRLPQVKEKYLGRLFVVVILELVGAGFWLFNETFRTEVTFQPSLPAEVYMFGGDGEPIQQTYLKVSDDTERTFNDTPMIKFDVPRVLKLASNGDHLLIKTQRADHQLGTIRINDLSQQIIDRVISIDHHLALGNYYAECLDFPECKERRDPSQAISHLIGVLQSDRSSPTQQKAATVKLFYLRHDLHSCERFLLLVDRIKRYRQEENRYPEIGDIYQTMCRSVHLNFDQCQTVYWQSLKYLLRFLSLHSVNPGTDLFERVVSQAADLAQYLSSANLPSLLDQFQDELSAKSEDQKFQPLPARLKKELGEASDKIKETFQCPA